jgi:hypothetical protein
MQAENVYRTKYDVLSCSDLNIKRGCAAGVYHHGHYYIFGGLNYSNKILKSSEKFID